MSEVCTVDPKALGFAASDFAVTREMADFFQKVIPPGARQRAEIFAIGDQAAQGFAGVPVSQTTYTGSTTIVNELQSVSRQSFDDATFAVPAGFTKTPMPMMGRGGR